MLKLWNLQLSVRPLQRKYYLDSGTLPCLFRATGVRKSHEHGVPYT